MSFVDKIEVRIVMWLSEGNEDSEHTEVASIVRGAIISLVKLVPKK